MSIDISEIDALAATDTPDISSEIYKNFTTDPDYVPTCIELILNSNKERTVYFSAKCLHTLTENNIAQWSTDFTTSVLENINQFLANAINHQIYSSRFNLTIHEIAIVYCIILNKNYTATNTLQDFTNELSTAMSSETANAIYLKFKFFQEILDYFKTFNDQRSSIKTEIANGATFSIFMMALSVLKDHITCSGCNIPYEPVEPKPIPEQSLTDQVVISCLQAMEKALDFGLIDSDANAVHKDEILSEVVIVKEIWRDIVTSPDLHEFIFSIGFANPLFMSHALDIIYLLCSVKKAMYMQDDLHIAVFSTIIRKTGEILSSSSEPQFLFRISKILFKLRKRVDASIDSEEYDAFLQLLYEKTEALLNDTNYIWILQQPHTMINLMKFWGCSKPKSTDHYQIMGHFFEQVLSLPDLDPEDTNQILCLDSGRVPDAIRVLPLYCHDFIPMILQSILDQLHTMFQQYISNIEPPKEGDELNQLKIIDKKNAIIILFLTTVIKYPISNADEAQLESLKVIIEIMHTVFDKSAAIYASQTSETVRSLLIMTEKFNQTNFTTNPDNCKQFQDFYFSDQQSAYDLLLQFVNSILQNFTEDENTISIAAAAFARIIETMNTKEVQNRRERTANDPQALTHSSQSKKTLLCCSQVASGILADFCSRPFDFMTQPGMDEYTIQTSKTLTIIAISNQTNAENFQAFLDANYEMFKSDTDEAVFTALINNFIGTFQACTTQKAYQKFFSWLFPTKLQEIVNFVCSSEIENLDLISKYFNFLYSTILPPDKTQDIRKPKFKLQTHSADGVHLFKVLAIALTDGLNRVVQIATQDSSLTYTQILDALMPMFKLMSQIMSAEFVMFEAFQFYEDSTLIDLMQALFQTLGNLNISDLFQFPEYAPTAMSLIMSLAKHHMDLLVANTPDFIGTMLEIVQLVIVGSNKDLINTAMETAQYIFKHFLENASEMGPIIEENKPHMQRIAFIVWANLINEESAKIFAVMQVLRPILIIMPEHMQAIHDYTIQFVPEANQGAFEVTIREVFVCVENLANVEESTFNKALIQVHQFASQIHLTVQIPSQ